MTARDSDRAGVAPLALTRAPLGTPHLRTRSSEIWQLSCCLIAI